MIKKLLIVGAVVLAGAFVFAKTDLGSYASTAWSSMKGCVKKQVPIDFEIKRAKGMVASLDKEADKLISVMANQMVAIESLEKKVTDGQARIEKDEQEIRVANDQLKSKDVVFVSTLGSTSREQFSIDLERRFNRFKVQKATLENQKQTLGTHRETLNAAKDHLEALRASRGDLQARIEKLETDLRIVRAAEARSKNSCTFDDSELKKVKDLVNQIEEQISARRYEVELRDGKRPTLVPVVTHNTTDLVKEIDSHFDTPAKDASAAAK